MKKKVIIGIAILAILLAVFLFFINLKKENVSLNEDAKKFASEYTKVTEDNVFVYRDINQIIKILEKGTGVVYLGFPECPWCQAYVKMLNEVAKEKGITKIYYYDILEDRKNNTSEYQKIVSLLSSYLQADEEGNPRVYVPNVTFVIKGEIIGNNCESSLDTHGFDNPDDYWTDEEVTALKSTLNEYMSKVASSSSCTECNID